MEFLHLAAKWPHYLLALALLIASGVGPVFEAFAKGDTNGDSEVDVLDLQRVIAEVLQSGDPAERAKADVNHDGVVDVLDFQALLTAAQQALPEPVAPRGNSRGTVTTERVADEALLRAPRVKSASPEEGKTASSTAARPAPVKIVASAKTERHLQNLSPHAPPASC